MKRGRRFWWTSISGFLLFAGFVLQIPVCKAVTQDNQPREKEPGGDSAKQPLTINVLKKAEYRSKWSAQGKIKLSDGIYREQIVPGSGSELVIKLSDKIALGDLNGDGLEDAAVILVSDPGGSGTFYDLAAVINSGGKAKNVASVFLGDRVKIEGLSVRSGKIVVKMLSHRSTDPICCPSLEVDENYGLQGDELVQQPHSKSLGGRR